MKTGKRVVSILLAVLMICTGIPFAFATENAPEVTNQTDYSVESTNSLGFMLSEVLESSATDPDEDYYISNLVMSENTATVTYHTNTNAQLVVAVYNEDTMQMLCAGTADAYAQETEVNVELSDLSAENMVIKAFLLDANHQALCKNYTYQEYTRAYKEFIEKNTSDFAADRVINLDEAQDNNFLVLDDSVKKVSKSGNINSLIDADFENNVYSFSNADASVTSLKAGDLFYYDSDDLESIIIVRVLSVSVAADGTATVQGEPIDLQTAFEYVRIHTEISDDQFASEDPDAYQLNSAPKKVLKKDSELDPEIGYSKEFSLNWPKKEPGQDDPSPLQLKGTGSYQVTADFKTYFGFNYQEISFVITPQFELTFEAELRIEEACFELAKLTVSPVAGLYISLNPTLTFTFSGKLSTSVTFGFSVGFGWTSKEGFVNKCKKLKPNFNGINIEANVFIGIDLKPKVSLLSDKIAKVELSGTIGLELTGKMAWLNGNDRVKHLCTNCIDGSLAFIFDVKFKIVFAEGQHGPFIKEKSLTFPIMNLKIPICDLYWSITYNKFGFGKCPYHLVKVNFKVTDAVSQEPIEDAVVHSGTKDSIAMHYNGDSSFKTTDANGTSFYYYPLGTFQATISSANYVTKKSKTIRIEYMKESDEFYVNDSSKQVEMHCKLDKEMIGAADGIGSDDDLSAGGTQFGIIQFGAYPQTKVTDSATISALNSRASGWQSYEYYIGTFSDDNGQMNPSNFMQYCDVKYKGCKYRGVKLDAYRPDTIGGTLTSSDQYKNGYFSGNTYWFQYEPLKWKVLDPSEGLVMCVSLIDSQPYNNYVLLNGTDSHGNKAYWGDAGKTYYANDYANSSIHDWLNKTFYATAFTEAQQNQIDINRKQNNNGYYTLTGNTGFLDYDSAPTNDKVFLLSYADATNPTYGFSTSTSNYSARRAKGTDYAKCQGLWVNNIGSYQGTSWWWLRSPGSSSDLVCEVSYSGYLDQDQVIYNYEGVRPVCKIFNLASGNAKSAALPLKAAPSAKATAEGGTGIYQYSNTACVAGNDYILLNVTGYGEDFTLTTQNLEYIDQLTADENGAVSGSFMPRNAVDGSTTLLIGDFGSGTEARQLIVTEQTQPEPHTHTYTSTVTTPATCMAEGVETFTCTCGSSYTRAIPALGHIDEDNNGYCDREGCGEMMTGGDHCPQCGKIHNGGFFDSITGFFHRLIYRLTHLFG